MKLIAFKAEWTLIILISDTDHFRTFHQDSCFFASYDLQNYKKEMVLLMIVFSKKGNALYYMRSLIELILFFYTKYLDLMVFHFNFPSK
jgi:hypothetical protein